jgi:cytochrome c peroxidase
MRLPWRVSRRGLLIIAMVTGAMLAVGAGSSAATLTLERQQAPFDSTIDQNASGMLAQGRQTFRFDTFGDQGFWGDTLQLHRAIEGQNLGGVGPGVSPKTALAVGLKVDVDALPEQLREQLSAGQVNLDDPATTLALMKLNAVVGVTGFFNPDGTLRSMGIQCALCHSTVDNSFAPGIGHRLDGWSNRDLNVGAIVSLAPNLQPVASLLGVDVPTLKAVLASWGPGKFDAEVFMDGKAVHTDASGVNRSPALIPPAYGLAGDNLHTWTGWGSVTYWNAFVANLEMHGVGTFFDERLDNAQQFPIAARNRFGHVAAPPGQDQITGKLAALQFYQLSIPAPTPPAGSFDPAAAARGQALFNGKAQCATCHVPPLFTEPGNNIHTPAEIGIDDFQANRAPAYVIGDATGNPVVVHGYRTAPLKGLWAHQKGGFFHDGRFATLDDVVNHYNTTFNLGLTPQEKHDLVQYLLSI